MTLSPEPALLLLLVGTVLALTWIVIAYRGVCEREKRID